MYAIRKKSFRGQNSNVCKKDLAERQDRILMKIIDNIKKSEMLAFFQQCRVYRKEEDFRKFVLEGYNNPDFLEIHSYGNEYHEKIVYEIGAFGRSVGFFAEFLYTLIRLYFASDRGFTPYVNWGSDFLYYEPDGIDNEKNAFLHYFEPVSEVTSINAAAHVLLAVPNHIHNVQNCLNTHGYAVSDEYMDALSNMVKKYIRYNKKTLDYLNRGYELLVGDKKALAVHFRGTDYRRQYNNHPAFVTIEQEIEKVREIFSVKGYEVIFLATDEQEAVGIFQKEFGEIVKVFEDTWRAGDGDESVAYSSSDRKDHHYLLGLEVLRDQYMLTRCDGLVCGISNVTLSARMMRKAWYDKDYDDLLIINHDLCHNDRQFCNEKH